MDGHNEEQTEANMLCGQERTQLSQNVEETFCPAQLDLVPYDDSSDSEGTSVLLHGTEDHLHISGTRPAPDNCDSLESLYDTHQGVETGMGKALSQASLPSSMSATPEEHKPSERKVQQLTEYTDQASPHSQVVKVTAMETTEADVHGPCKPIVHSPCRNLHLNFDVEDFEQKNISRYHCRSVARCLQNVMLQLMNEEKPNSRQCHHHGVSSERTSDQADVAERRLRVNNLGDTGKGIHLGEKCSQENADPNMASSDGGLAHSSLCTSQPDSKDAVTTSCEVVSPATCVNVNNGDKKTSKNTLCGSLDTDDAVKGASGTVISCTTPKQDTCKNVSQQTILSPEIQWYYDFTKTNSLSCSQSPVSCVQQIEAVTDDTQGFSKDETALQHGQTEHSLKKGDRNTFKNEKQLPQQRKLHDEFRSSLLSDMSCGIVSDSYLFTEPDAKRMKLTSKQTDEKTFEGTKDVNISIKAIQKSINYDKVGASPLGKKELTSLVPDTEGEYNLDNCIQVLTVSPIPVSPEWSPGQLSLCGDKTMNRQDLTSQAEFSTSDNSGMSTACLQKEKVHIDLDTKEPVTGSIVYEVSEEKLHVNAAHIVVAPLSPKKLDEIPKSCESDRCLYHEDTVKIGNSEQRKENELKASPQQSYGGLAQGVHSVKALNEDQKTLKSPACKQSTIVPGTNSTPNKIKDLKQEVSISQKRKSHQEDTVEIGSSEQRKENVLQASPQQSYGGVAQGVHSVKALNEDKKALKRPACKQSTFVSGANSTPDKIKDLKQDITTGQKRKSQSPANVKQTTVSSVTNSCISTCTANVENAKPQRSQTGLYKHCTEDTEGCEGKAVPSLKNACDISVQTDVCFQEESVCLRSTSQSSDDQQQPCHDDEQLMPKRDIDQDKWCQSEDSLEKVHGKYSHSTKVFRELSLNLDYSALETLDKDTNVPTLENVIDDLYLEALSRIQICTDKLKKHSKEDKLIKGRNASGGEKHEGVIKQENSDLMGCKGPVKKCQDMTDKCDHLLKGEGSDTVGKSEGPAKMFPCSQECKSKDMIETAKSRGTDNECGATPGLGETVAAIMKENEKKKKVIFQQEKQLRSAWNSYYLANEEKNQACNELAKARQELSYYHAHMPPPPLRSCHPYPMAVSCMSPVRPGMPLPPVSAQNNMGRGIRPVSIASPGYPDGHPRAQSGLYMDRFGGNNLHQSDAGRTVVDSIRAQTAVAFTLNQLQEKTECLERQSAVLKERRELIYRLEEENETLRKDKAALEELVESLRKDLDVATTLLKQERREYNQKFTAITKTILEHGTPKNCNLMLTRTITNVCPDNAEQADEDMLQEEDDILKEGNTMDLRGVIHRAIDTSEVDHISQSETQEVDNPMDSVYLTNQNQSNPDEQHDESLQVQDWNVPGRGGQSWRRGH